jgi:hypothetical protein
MPKLLQMVLVAVICGGIPLAKAEIIDFQSLESSTVISYIGIGRIYCEDGFVISSWRDDSRHGFAYFTTSSSSYPGSTALFNNSTYDTTCLSREDAGYFRMTSIALTPLGPLDPNTSITFFGYRGTNLVGSCSALVSNVTTTFALSNLNHVTEVRWTSQYPATQFDNIQVEPEVSSLPEPKLTIRKLQRYSGFGEIYFNLEYLQVGKTYIVQRSTNMVDWVDSATLFPYTTQREYGEFFDDTTTTRLFYRLTKP